ncbi:hypothetical protein [Butyricimonas synergistica]|uniref:hypothetical protein n=1 Tax=Butyricimonas synergistica TaxID=544644 RepID=UPI000370C26F|nr:hypothetical protein [Butyricimonas synergistica]
MKQTLLICILLSISITTFGEKKKNTLNLLRKNTRHAIHPDLDNHHSSITLKFTRKQEIYKLKLDTGQKKPQKYKIKEAYYLSETPNTNFNQTKVGKIKNGKYLIVRAYNRVETFRIHLLTSTYLKIELIGGAILEYQKKRKKSNKSTSKLSQ